MHYHNLSDRDNETKIAMSVVNEKLRSNQVAHKTQKAYPRFRIGNMAFVEIFTALPEDVKDLDIPPEYVVVVLGDESRLVRLPNKELFAKFASAVRADPDLMKPRQRTMAALVLATGYENYIDRSGVEPSWEDEDGTLTIRYYKYVRKGMSRPRVELCTLTVAENQDYSIECCDVGYDVPRE